MEQIINLKKDFLKVESIDNLKTDLKQMLYLNLGFFILGLIFYKLSQNEKFINTIWIYSALVIAAGFAYDFYMYRKACSELVYGYYFVTASN